MNERIIVNNNKRKHIPTVLKGITPEQIKSINARQGKTVSFNQRTDKPMPRIINRKITPGVRTPPPPPRPKAKFLTNIIEKSTTIDLPDIGAFNAGIAKFPGREEYILVYRPDEYGFIGCKLDKDLNVVKSTIYERRNELFKFNITNCADPRIIWTPDNKLLMIYSSTEEGGLKYECIRGAIIMDLNKSEEFIDAKPFRVSPNSLKDRQKNWTPFVHDRKIYLIASVCPHIVYELILLNNNEVICEKRFESDWLNPWFQKEFLRGNTNPVLMADGNYLNTFHTAVRLGITYYYDNGCYIFEGKPPFRVLKCGNQTYMPAEAAIEPHFRKYGYIQVCFPVGMVLEENKLLISYGDNDSIVKIAETTVDKMVKTTVEVY